MTASHILDGGAHILIDAAIYQHIMKHAFTEEELGQMRTFMEKVADGTMGARHTDQVVVIFGADINEGSQIRRWTEQREDEKQ